MDLLQTQLQSIIDRDVLKFRHLRVWTPEEKSWWRRKVTKSKTTILDDISGSFKEGEFAAILGPSGAGKTTFLVSLAGKCTLPSEGVVTVRGRNVKELPRGLEIVPQNEVFSDNLTAMEHLVFMTELKLGDSRLPSNRQTMHAVMHDLKLKPHAHTPVGSLSGGERRRLSLASSLLSTPEILICDEPTNGLDSYNAALVVSILKRIAAAGKVVICSIHQPSSDLFREFSSILLVAEGKLLFHGSLDECKVFFERSNLHCPRNYNPAEFYVKAISVNPHSGASYVNRLLQMKSPRNLSTQNDGNGTASEGNLNTPARIYRRNWFKQVQLLLWRNSLSLSRGVRNEFWRLLFCTTMSSIVISACYAGISGTTQQGVQDMRGLLWLMCSEVTYANLYGSTYAFAGEIALFRREVGLYTVSAYYVTKLLSAVPKCIIWAVSFVTIATLAVEVPNAVSTDVEFIVTLIATAITATAFGLAMAALFTSSGLMGEIVASFDIPLSIMGGSYMRISSLPTWLTPLKYAAHFFYTTDALNNIYWRQIQNIDCPSNSTSDCVHSGMDVLLENGYSQSFLLVDSVGLASLTLIWSILACYGLWREEKKGFAY